MRQNAERTFAWGEVLYFRRWYEGQSSQMQAYVAHLIQEGRWEFVHGGWIENDHASVSYQAIIEQMTLGYEYLRSRFGIVPRFGYDIDPFGHSSHVAHLYKQMGVEMIIMNRVHWKIKQMMKQSQNLEFLWMTNAQLMLFTHILHTHYAAPQGFDFENPGVPNIHQGNVAQRSQLFVDKMRERARAYRTNVILIPWGDDFKFRDASRQYSSMDLLIQWINSNVGDVHIQYSTVSRYFDDMQHEATEREVKFSVVSHDFFPYADNEDSYWTGHFTSLPNLKKDIRRGEAALRTTERLFTTASVLQWSVVQPHYAQFSNQLHQIRDLLAVLYHHDSITGTCRKHVANDYSGKAQQALEQSERMQSKLVEIVLGGGSDEHGNTGRLPKSFHSISRTTLEKSSTPYRLAITNPVAHARHELIHIVSKTPHVQITTSGHAALPVSIVPRLINQDNLAANFDESESYNVYFVVHCAALATREFMVDTSGKSGTAGQNSVSQNILYTNAKISSDLLNTKTHSLSSAPNDLQIENDKYIVKFSSHSGSIVSVQNKLSHQTHSFGASQFAQYHTKRSGSYIFRPEHDAQDLADNKLQHILISKHSHFEEVIVLGSKIHQRVRLMKLTLGKSPAVTNRYIQQTLFIAPLPGDTELMSNYFIADGDSSLITYDGVNFVKRNVRHDAPIAARFYPSPSGAIYRGKKSQLTVLTQHAMGVTVSAPSTSPTGHLGFMVHRRLLKDDGRGMSEGNNDESSLVVNFLLSYDSVEGVHEGKFLEFHRMSHSWNHPVIGFAAKTDRGQQGVVHRQISLLNQKNPNMKHVELISMDQRGTSSNEVVVRLHNLHATKAVKVNLANLFDSRYVSLVSVTETTLNLAYILPRDEKLFETKFLHEHKKTILDFRASVHQSGSNVAQNTNEEGVFLSDAALEHANVGARKLHSIVDKNFVYEIRPAEIATFTVELKGEGPYAASVGSSHGSSTVDDNSVVQNNIDVTDHDSQQNLLHQDVDEENTEYIDEGFVDDSDPATNPIYEQDIEDSYLAPPPIFDNADSTGSHLPSQVSNDNLLDGDHDQVVLDHTFDLYFILIVVCSALCVTLLVYMLRKRLPLWLRQFLDDTSSSVEASLEMEGLKQV